MILNRLYSGVSTSPDFEPGSGGGHGMRVFHAIKEKEVTINKLEN